MNDIGDMINRKIWTVDDLISRVNELIEKSKNLSLEERKKNSITIDDWSEDNVKKCIENIKEAVINPIRHKNKNKLKKIGIHTERILETDLDNTQIIDTVIRLFESIKLNDNRIADVLIQEQLLETWLIYDFDKVVQKLQGIINIKSELKEIIEMKLDERFKREITTRILKDVNYLDEAEQIISKINHLKKFGILIEYDTLFEKLCDDIKVLSEKIVDVVDNFGIPEDEIMKKVKGKSHIDSCNIIDQIRKDLTKKKEKILDDLKTYVSLLKSLGEEIPETLSSFSELRMKTLPELEEYLRTEKERSLLHLGEDGLKLLRFLGGEDDFPEEISVNEIKKTLKILRPIFVRGMEGI